MREEGETLKNVPLLSRNRQANRHAGHRPISPYLCAHPARAPAERKPRSPLHFPIAFIYKEGQPGKGSVALMAVSFHCFLDSSSSLPAWAGRQQRWGLEQISQRWCLEGRRGLRGRGPLQDRGPQQPRLPGMPPCKMLVPGLSGTAPPLGRRL